MDITKLSKQAVLIVHADRDMLVIDWNEAIFEVVIGETAVVDDDGTVLGERPVLELHATGSVETP